MARTNGRVAGVTLFESPIAERGVDDAASIYYFLPDSAQSLKLEVLDAQGAVIRSFEATATADSTRRGDGQAAGRQGGGGFGQGGGGRPSLAPGLNRFTWDLRYPGFTTFPGMIMWAAGNRGPVAVPGDYTVRLTADGTTRTAPLRIGIDPRLEGQVVQQDLVARFDLASQVVSRVDEANRAVIMVRDVATQVDERLDETDNARIEELGARVKSGMADVEGRIYQVRNQSSQDPLNYPIMLNNKLAALLGIIERGEYRPTDQSYEVFNLLSGQLQTELDALNAIIATDLAELNRLLQQNDLPVIRVVRQADITT
jgi:hypothetical protein